MQSLWEVGRALKIRLSLDAEVDQTKNGEFRTLVENRETLKFLFQPLAGGRRRQHEPSDLRRSSAQPKSLPATHRGSPRGPEIFATIDRGSPRSRHVHLSTGADSSTYRQRARRVIARFSRTFNPRTGEPRQPSASGLIDA